LTVVCRPLWCACGAGLCAAQSIGATFDSEKLVECDWQVAYAVSGGVVDGVGDGGSCADDADLADASGPHGVGVRIGFTEPDRFDLVDVGVVAMW
jgi:hypothetical protein